MWPNCTLCIHRTFFTEARRYLDKFTVLNKMIVFDTLMKIFSSDCLKSGAHQLHQILFPLLRCFVRSLLQPPCMWVSLPSVLSLVLKSMFYWVGITPLSCLLGNILFLCLEKFLASFCNMLWGQESFAWRSTVWSVMQHLAECEQSV